MENHIRTGLFRGNKVMVQMNKMKEQRTTDQNQEVEEKGHFQVCYVVYAGSLHKKSVYTQVHYTKLLYTYARIFIEEKALWDEKLRKLR